MQASEFPSLRSDPDRFPNAACKPYPVSLFYPDDDRESAEAVAICQTCPHIDPCREYALALPERYGVWGGLSERDRHALLAAQPRRDVLRTLYCANDTCRRPFDSRYHNQRFCSQTCRNTQGERNRNHRVR